MTPTPHSHDTRGHQRRSPENVLAKVLEITSPSGNVAEKPCIFLEGGIHSREWIATSTVLYIAGVGRAIRHKVFGLKVVGGIIL